MDKVSYLIFENETFLGGPPSNSSDDIFELVEVNANSVAFRVIRQNSSQSGSGTSEDKRVKEQVQSSLSSESDETNNVQMESDEPPKVVSECYLGFADITSEPKCYTSTDFAATRFRIIHGS